jgi:SAM-dependent methyltransferase
VTTEQYRDDRNLRARQRLWEISRSEPDLDFNQWSVDLTGVARGDVVLDAGCGNGRPLALLQRRCTVVAIDLSPGMIVTASHPLSAAADVQALPFADGCFDAAVAFMMLYHVPHRERAAAELRRVMRDGGVFVATTASRDNQVELRTIVEAAVGSGWTWARPSTIDFNLEEGGAMLATAFRSVELVPLPDRRIYVTDADALADYLASVGTLYEPGLPPGRRWVDVVRTVHVRVAEVVAREGAFVVTAKLGAFVCR